MVKYRIQAQNYIILKFHVPMEKNTMKKLKNKKINKFHVLFLAILSFSKQIRSEFATNGPLLVPLLLYLESNCCLKHRVACFYVIIYLQLGLPHCEGVSSSQAGTIS